MKLRIQVVFAEEDSMPKAVEEITLLEKSDRRMEDLGLTLKESKEFLRDLQRRIVERQAALYAERHRTCRSCGRACRKKGSTAITFRTLFGNVELRSPRFYSCPCQESRAKTFSPLTGLLPEHTAPELVFMETQWSSLVSYSMAVRMLKEALPVDEKLNAATARNHLIKVAERCPRPLVLFGELTRSKVSVGRE